MKNIACFCIPAHGHINPMLPVAKELVSRGHRVRFYSFEEFREKIEKTGAEYVSCDRFLPELDREQESRLKNVSVTEMTLQDLGTTRNMDGFMSEEVRSFRPDLIYTDAVCFWGKLTAKKYGIPMVVSTSTFAFNQLSQQYQKQSFREIMDLMLGMDKTSKALKALEPYGYHEKSILKLVQNDNKTDTVVYTTRHFQPCGWSFSDHYAFVGPSVFSRALPNKEKPRPLVYISMGTVINDRPALYKNCTEALRDENLDVIISCGASLDPKVLEPLPENVQVFPRVDQPEVLSRADVFLTHCGMNSVSESLYMATPMVLFPQTGEQRAVARRAAELGAGVHLKEDSVQAIREAVLTVLKDPSCAEAAARCSRDLRAGKGPAGAAEFIENAPHPDSQGPDPMGKFHKMLGLRQLAYWTVGIGLIAATGVFLGWNWAWIPGTAAGILNQFYTGIQTERLAKKLSA